MREAAAPLNTGVDDESDNSSRSYDSRSYDEEASRSFLSGDDGDSLCTDDNDKYHHKRAARVSDNEEDDEGGYSDQEEGDEEGSYMSGQSSGTGTGSYDDEGGSGHHDDEDMSHSGNHSNHNQDSYNSQEEESESQYSQQQQDDGEDEYVDDSSNKDDDSRSGSGSYDSRSLVDDNEGDGDHSYVSSGEEEVEKPDNVQDQSYRSGDSRRSQTGSNEDEISDHHNNVSRLEEDADEHQSYVSGNDDDDDIDDSHDSGHDSQEGDRDQNSDADDGTNCGQQSASNGVEEEVSHDGSNYDDDRSHSDSRSYDDDHPSHSQEEDVSEGGRSHESSMSMSELADDDTSPSRGIREVHQQQTNESTKQRQSPRKPAAAVEENSMWLSQLEKSGLNPTPRRSPVKKTVSSAKQSAFGRNNAMPASTVQKHSAAVTAAAEKSLWLSDLEKPSDESNSQDDDSARTESQHTSPTNDGTNSQEYDDDENSVSNDMDPSYDSREKDLSNSQRYDDEDEIDQSNSASDGQDGRIRNDDDQSFSNSNSQPHEDSSVSKEEGESQHDNSYSHNDSFVSGHEDQSHSNSQSQQEEFSGTRSQDFDNSYRYASGNDDNSQSQQGHDDPSQSNSEDRSHTMSDEDDDENDSFRDEKDSPRNDDQSYSHSNSSSETYDKPMDSDVVKKHDSSQRNSKRNGARHATNENDFSDSFSAGDTRHERSISNDIGNKNGSDDDGLRESRHAESRSRGKYEDDEPSEASTEPSFDDAFASEGSQPHIEASLPTTSMASSIDECESSFSGFESFANDGSVASPQRILDREESLKRIPHPENDAEDEDVSALSLLPADTYAKMGTNHPLDQPSVMSISSSDRQPVHSGQRSEKSKTTRSARKSERRAASKKLLVLPGSNGSQNSVRTFDDYSTVNGSEEDQDDQVFASDEQDVSGNSEDDKHDAGSDVFGAVHKGDFFSDSNPKSKEIDDAVQSTMTGVKTSVDDATIQNKTNTLTGNPNSVSGSVSSSPDNDNRSGSEPKSKSRRRSDQKSVASESDNGNSIASASGAKSTRRSDDKSVATRKSTCSGSDKAEISLRLPKPKTYGGYSREQIGRLVSKSIGHGSGTLQSIGLSSSPKKKNRQDFHDRGKSEALIEFATNVSETMKQIEKERDLTKTPNEDKENDTMLTSCRLLYAFEALVGVFLQLSDEFELLLTFSKGKDSPTIKAIESLLSFSKPIGDTFVELKPILLNYLSAEIDEELDDFLYGMNLLVDLLSELSNRVGEKQLWNARANTAFATLLELLVRDTLEVSCIFEDVDTPDYEITYRIQDAWEATGHVEEVKTLLVTADLFMFRQICYEVMLSTDQWCPDNNVLMDICGVDDESDDGQIKPDEDDVLSPPPEAALQILEKIHGEPLPRTLILASVLRRILSVQAITDPSISENFGKIRNTVRNPLGMPPSSLVTITSISECIDDLDSLGLAGVGKTTLAAMVANHVDVRRFFNDGVAWIYIGDSELNYNRYVQCLQDLLSQLEVEEDEEPLFPELLHIPGETYSMRRRREEGFMIYLRETMVEFLRFRNVLIVLDDVCFEPDLDWFDFAQVPLEDEEPEDDAGCCAILITSRRRNLLPPADTVEVDMLEEEEGVKLLISESGELARALIADAPETKSVVSECACHPLTIKSVGRWLNLKHATAESGESVDDIRNDVVQSMNKILTRETDDESDMMYEMLNMSLSPAINGEPTSIIKFCLAAFVRVFCERKHISDFALADSTPIIPMATTELLFESLLDLEEESLLQEGSLFFAQKKEAAKLIPEALSALGIFKVIITFAETVEGSTEPKEDEKYLQIMHRIQQEYGEYLFEEDETLTELTKDGENRWNKAFAEAFIGLQKPWDTKTPDAGLDYALEMLPSHMLRADMVSEAADLLRNEKFVRGRLFALGRENGCRRQIKDCETLFGILTERKKISKKRLDPKVTLRSAYETLGSLLKMDEDEYIEEEGSPEAIEVGRCHIEIGLSLAGRRCWEGAISHWESSQVFIVSSLGMVELVAGILYNIGVVNVEISEYDQALGSLKQCLRIRGAIHGEEHILYAQTIQKIGDVFLAMSDYHEAMESYDWALDVMHIEPSHHQVDIGDILEQMGKIHYSKGEIEEALESFKDSLRSKQVDLGEDHPELSSIFHQIGNCLSNQGRSDEAIAHLEEAIRLKNLDSDGGYERDSDVLTIEGILNNLNNMQKEGLECYEKALQILVTKVPNKKEKVASLLHLIGCVYLMSGEHRKAMKLFEESLHARRKVLGFVHLDVASTLFNMAFLHQSRNRLDKALKCLEEALKIRQLRLPDSEKVAVTHEKIGSLARGIGKTKKAENAFSEALRIRKIIHGNNHEAVAAVLQELGDLMDDLGEYEDAIKHYVDALEIRENRLGPDDLAVAETYYSMGFTLQNNGALDRALQCLEESLSIRKFQLGDDAKDVGDTLNMMGFLQAKRGELDDALSLLWDSLRIRKLLSDHVKVSETLNNIGNVHREKQEFDLAIECYEECLRIRRAELGDEHEKVADALIAKGIVQSDMEYNDEAMDSYKEALAIRNMIFGEQDESVATVLQHMGTLEFRANELDRAFQLLDEFIRIRQENGTEHDGDYVNALFVIGNIHKMQSNEEEAKKCWTQAYGVFKELGLAETNPQIAEVMGNLVKDEEVVTSTPSQKTVDSKSAAKSVLNRLTAKVKKAARTANEAGNAVKKVTGIKGQDRGSQLL